MANTQLIHSDSNIIFTPLQKSLYRFTPAYTYLTTAAAYPSEINKTDIRNLNWKASPRVTDYRAAKIDWDDDKHWNRTVALASAVADGTTTTFTLSAADAATIVVNQVLKVASTGEQVLVTAKPSSTTLTVIRAFGTTAAAAIANGTKLIVLGTALYDKDEGSGMRAPVMTDHYINYMQTLDVSYELTEGAQYYDFQGGKLFPRVSKEGAIEAAYNLEDTYWYGEPKQYFDPSNAANAKQTMCGLVPFLKQYGKVELNMQGTTALDLPTMLAFEDCFKPDSTNKGVWMCSAKALTAIDNILLSSQRITDTDTVNLAVGMRVKVFHSTLRDIELVHAPALDKEGNDVDIVRYNPAEYMEMLATDGGWKYKECEKDFARTYQKYWIHGTFGAKFHLPSDVGGITRGVKNPLTSFTFVSGNDYIV